MNAVRLKGPEGVLQRDVPLTPLTTYRFGGPARYFAEVTDMSELEAVLEARNEAGNAGDQHVPLLTLGRGSNLVVSDTGFDGLVIRLAGDFLEVDLAGDGESVVAGAAFSLPKLARRAVGWGRGGLEWGVGIPGSVGGAVRMNAGGHGSDTAEWLISAEVIDAGTGVAGPRGADELDLGYRHSNLADGEVVVAATFRTTAQPKEVGDAKLREITRWRRDHQPGGTLTAGSVFKNPPDVAAAELIDRLGLKGYRVGGAFVSPRHANFFEAERTATALDVYRLVADVRDKVRAATGISLEPEIMFVGEFARGAGEGP